LWIVGIAASRATYRPFPPGQLNFILEEDYFYVAQNQKKYLYEEVSKVWYNLLEKLHITLGPSHLDRARAAVKKRLS